MSLSDTLFNIAPNSIQFDEFNPRGETAEQIINDEDFHKLKDSISQIGVLVPLIVKKNQVPNTGKEFILIVGERRLRASMDLSLEKIPVRIVQSDVEGKIIAYQIHQNRKAWSKPSEAKSIQSIINSIKVDDPNISDTDLKKKLIEVTSHKPTAINDILKILKYDEDVQDKSSKGEIEHSYLIRIEDDFIAPVNRVYPELIDTFGENEIRRIMIHKAELKLLINTRYMMNSSFKEIFKPSLYRDEICTLIGTFLQSPEQSVSDLFTAFQNIKQKEEENINKEENKSSVNVDGKINASRNDDKLSVSPNEKNREQNTTEQGGDSLNKNNTKKNSGTNTPATNAERTPIIIAKAKKSGFNAIKESLENLSKQYTEEELEYIKEAIVCLSTERALKASVLMIWASSISRILKYIEKDIARFNTASETMQLQKKSFYKFYAANFQKSATTIEDIKEVAKDMQLLCYLCYEGIITPSQFKQLKGYYDIRNECAHPTTLKLCMNEVLAIFENLVSFIFSNPKLK